MPMPRTKLLMIAIFAVLCLSGCGEQRVAMSADELARQDVDVAQQQLALRARMVESMLARLDADVDRWPSTAA